jgi:predicted RNase H-like HicB family nuclease
MVEEAMKTYRVAYERDESSCWVASVRGVRGCHTQGRTVEEARRRIIEALGLFVGNAHNATIVDDVKPPKSAARVVRAYATLRKKAEEEDPTCSPRSQTGRSSAASRATEDERARCCTPVGAIASADTPAHAERRPTRAGITRHQSAGIFRHGLVAHRDSIECVADRSM